MVKMPFEVRRRAKAQQEQTFFGHDVLIFCRRRRDGPSARQQNLKRVSRS